MKCWLAFTSRTKMACCRKMSSERGQRVTPGSCRPWPSILGLILPVDRDLWPSVDMTFKQWPLDSTSFDHWKWATNCNVTLTCDLQWTWPLISDLGIVQALTIDTGPHIASWPWTITFRRHDFQSVAPR